MDDVNRRAASLCGRLNQVTVPIWKRSSLRLGFWFWLGQVLPAATLMLILFQLSGHARLGGVDAKGVGMVLPGAVAQSNTNEQTAGAPERSDAWLPVLFFVVVAAILIGLIQLGTFLANRPHHHPEFYGDYRGGYARGLDLRATGQTSNDCEGYLRGAYASPKAWPAIQAKGIYVVGCRRGANGKPLGDYTRRVDDMIGSND